MQVRLLGPVDVVDGTPRPVPGKRRRAVLAVLALHAGRPVSPEQLIEAVWDGQAPATAQNSLQRLISYLRGILGMAGAIVAGPSGYILDLGANATDAEVAERLVRQAGTSTDPAHRASLLRATLGLWRGRPLADVAGLRWLDKQAERLDALRVEAERALIEARLALGEHAELVPDLERMVQDDPFDERAHARLMLALYRAGRQVDALTTYQRLRKTLGDELGLDPGPELRDLESAILRQDPSLDQDPPLPGAAARISTTGEVPAQLPRSVSAFAGRVAELATLDATAAGIVVICGTAGVGKTTLAVHWAHQMAARYPDGQLYVNLRGFDPCCPATEPAEAMRAFLDALGVPSARIPAGPHALTGLYRSLLAGKRMLILLDNARDAEQVRPLLPGAPGCLVIVTSRDQLNPLVVTEGADPLTLDVFDPDEARDLLSSRVGEARLKAEPDAVATISARCARLPLALAIAAARAAVQPRLSLAMLAAQLSDAADALAPFQGGDAATDIRAVFSWSYRTLDADAARLFRLLGLHPGPDLGITAAASLIGVSPRQVRPLLAELTHAHLLAEHAPGRYTFHDLLRAYAMELARGVETADERDAARRRVLDHYVHTAYSAAFVIHPQRSPIAVEPISPGTSKHNLSDHDDALQWFTTERAVLLAAVEDADRTRLDAHVWQLAWGIADFLEMRGHVQDWIAVQTRAVAAARRAGDPAILGRMLVILGNAFWRVGRYDDAFGHLQEARDLFSNQADLTWHARTEQLLGGVLERQGRFRDALEHATRSLWLARSAGDLDNQARALNSMGWSHIQLGNYQQAVNHTQQALEHYAAVDDRQGLAATWDSLGLAHHHLSHYEQAVDCYQRSIDLQREVGDRYNEAGTLTRLADTYQAAGRHDAAIDARRQALAILDEIDHSDADLIRAELRAAARAHRRSMRSSTMDR